MKSFAYIVNPVTIKELKDVWRPARILPDFILHSAFRSLKPFKIAQLEKIKSRLGQEISGFLILCPLLEGLSGLKEEFIIDKIIAASRIAQELGAEILGLSGYAAEIADKGNLLAKNLKIPLTSGNSYTSWSIFEAIYRISKAKNIELKKSSLAIIGAANPIGSLCARKLSSYVKKIAIFDREPDKLGPLKEAILQIEPGVEVIIAEDGQGAVKDADIVINADSLAEVLLQIKELKPGAIVCVIGAPPDRLIEAESRPDLTIIEAGLVKLPQVYNLRVNSRLPKGVVPASLAQTMLLTFERRFSNYSLLAEGINLDRLEDIADLAARCGFEVYLPQAPLQ